jgi:hypothetical protein
MSGPTWTTISPGLIQIFTELALPDPANPQAPAWLAEWRDRARKAAPTGGPLKGLTLTLKITSVIGIGDDDRRFTYVAPAVPPALPTPWDDSLQEDIYGLRRVTLNLQANMSEVSDGSWAVGLLESIRTRLRRQRIIDALLALNVGIIRSLAAQDISSRAQQHTQSRASMDLLLTMVASDSDPVPTGWIQKLDISSLIQDVSGATLPVPPNFNHLRVTAP